MVWHTISNKTIIISVGQKNGVSNLCENVYNQTNTLKLYKVKTLGKRYNYYLEKNGESLFLGYGLEIKNFDEKYIIFPHW